jgi:hypothetical protein
MAVLRVEPGIFWMSVRSATAWVNLRLKINNSYVSFNMGCMALTWSSTQQNRKGARKIATATWLVVICCNYPISNPPLWTNRTYFTGWDLIKTYRVAHVSCEEMTSESCMGLKVAQKGFSFFRIIYPVPNFTQIRLVFSDMKHANGETAILINRIMVSFLILSTTKAQVVRKGAVGPFNVCTT